MSLKGEYATQYNPPFRQGTVFALESTPPYRVRVQFPDRDNVISYWLPINVPKIMQDKFFWQPDIGELVLCIMDEHDENGVVVGAIPNEQDAAPAGLTPDNFYIGFKDGTTISYNRATHVLEVSLAASGSFALTGATGSTVSLDASGDISFNSTSAIRFQLGEGAADDGLALVSKLVAAFNAHSHPALNAPPTVPWTTDTVSSETVKVTD